MSNLLVKRAELEKAVSDASTASDEFHKIQIEVNKERIIAAERVGWFSAGAISLSFTLIGFLFSNTLAKQVIVENVFSRVPLVYFLILGWCCLLLAIIFSLLVRAWNASYLNYNKAQHWVLVNKESKNKTLEAIAAGVEFVFTDATTQKEGIKNIELSRDNFSDLEKAFSLRAKIWIKASNYAQSFIYSGSVFGLIFLSVFLIIITYRLVYN